ncbi:DUF2161 family putative PD-(D/E)XK-type phosphodiesterase [Cognatishimia sp. SS12]|uniref:DUF2161 domain-containing phosphodiesterase n=1 Tax=Cognatishimia sp. SS12 TaxID=2979465 RepID=UPI00232D2745|nr:DUF2161 family putative PD-(D/E)XK-type phosphodiesterase [Cognatishimia sp. SS12]MDC0738181.1 DUF2161 family putative PD-(D/E)XK-type phosphodiesterase [Cognatishimia sp. SS12]
MQETDLYAPVKTWLEGQGFEVKSEIGAADVVAVRGADDPVVVELKTGFSLTLLQQGVARQQLSDWVYVAVPRWKGKSGWRTFKGNVGLCKRLGLGVISVNLADQSVQVHADPVEFRPRKSKPRRGALLKEFARRQGDPNAGGTRGPIVTGYQQEAERCLAYLIKNGPSKGADVAKAVAAPTATAIMRANHYGWFENTARGIYCASPVGLARQQGQD